MSMRLAVLCGAVLAVSSCTSPNEESTGGAAPAPSKPSSSASSESLGTLLGSFPACIGPGVNVRPLTIVEVRQAGRVVKSIRVTTDEKHHEYRIALTPGEYDARLSVWPHDVKVVVQTGRTIKADLQGPACL